MQYSTLAVAALVASASAHYANQTVVYTTEVHTQYTTVCPTPTKVTYNGKTYTVTEATTLTITDCPCTVVKPVTTTSVVVPTSKPVYHNATTAAPTTTKASVGTTVVPSPRPTTTPIEASSGNKAFVLSGASLAGLLGLAAYLL